MTFGHGLTHRDMQGILGPLVVDVLGCRVTCIVCFQNTLLFSQEMYSLHTVSFKIKALRRYNTMNYNNKQANKHMVGFRKKESGFGFTILQEVNTGLPSETVFVGPIHHPSFPPTRTSAALIFIVAPLHLPPDQPSIMLM